jgi:hypothetical protein
VPHGRFISATEPDAIAVGNRVRRVLLVEGSRMHALSANRRGEFDEAGRALKHVAKQIGQLGIEARSNRAITRW